MKCKDCAEGKRHSAGSVYCIQYGIILSANHECGREGAKIRGRERDADHMGDVGHADQLPADEWDAIDRLEGIL